MIKVIKLGNKLYRNIEPVAYEPVAFDENGNPTDFRQVNLLPSTQTELAQIVKETMLVLARDRLRNVLETYGYNSLGDVQLYASQNDPEAQAILNFYTNANSNGYDDLLWNYIDSLVNMTVDQLMNDLQDLTAVEENIYQQAVANNPLP